MQCKRHEELLEELDESVQRIISVQNVEDVALECGIWQSRRDGSQSSILKSGTRRAQARFVKHDHA